MTKQPNPGTTQASESTSSAITQPSPTRKLAILKENPITIPARKAGMAEAPSAISSRLGNPIIDGAGICPHRKVLAPRRNRHVDTTIVSTDRCDERTNQDRKFRQLTYGRAA